MEETSNKAGQAPEAEQREPNDYEVRVELRLDNMVYAATIGYADGMPSYITIGFDRIPAGMIRLIQNVMMSGTGESFSGAAPLAYPTPAPNFQQGRRGPSIGY